MEEWFISLCSSWFTATCVSTGAASNGVPYVVFSGDTSQIIGSIDTLQNMPDPDSGVEYDFSEASLTRNFYFFLLKSVMIMQIYLRY